MLTLSLAPVLLAACADENKSHSVLGRLGEAHCLVVPAMLANYVLSTLQSWVFDAFRVNLEILSTHREVSPVNTIVDFASLHGWRVIRAECAYELKEASLVGIVSWSIFFRVQHVVTFRTETHALELLLLTLATACTILRHTLSLR